MLNAWLSFLKNRCGDDAVNEAIGALDPGDRVKLDTPLLDSSWYPIEMTRVLTKLQSLLVKTDVAEELGRYIAEYTFKGVYRVFLSTDPMSQANKIQRAGEYFYRNVHKLEVEATGPSSCILRYRTGRGKPSVTTCKIRRGWWVRTFELSGATSVRVLHPRCIAGGHECCEFLMEWVMPKDLAGKNAG